MSLTLSHSLSLLNLGWWPSATKDTEANKSSSFQHLPSPKGLPTATTPPLVKMGPWLYSSFSISPYSPTDTPFLTDKTSIVPCPSEEETLFSPLWQKPSEAKMGTASRDAWDPVGVPLLPLLLFSRLLVHPSLALALFFTFNTPLLWGSLTQLAPQPFHSGELSALHKDIKWQQWEKTARFGRKRYSTWLSVAILHAFCSLGCSWNR